jgi:large subunit ribosomal protein L13
MSNRAPRSWKTLKFKSAPASREQLFVSSGEVLNPRRTLRAARCILQVALDVRAHGAISFRRRKEEMSTYIPSAHEIERKWFVVDASGKTLGRLATEAASVLSGKRNPKYVPYIDMGDHVVVINAEKVRLTGLKSQQKVYRRYTGFPGGLREESFTRLLERKPEKIVEEAIKGMLPKTKMGRKMASKLNVYRGDKHPHAAQKPVALEINA